MTEHIETVRELLEPLGGDKRRQEQGNQVPDDQPSGDQHDRGKAHDPSEGHRGYLEL